MINNILALPTFPFKAHRIEGNSSHAGHQEAHAFVVEALHPILGCWCWLWVGNHDHLVNAETQDQSVELEERESKF